MPLNVDFDGAEVLWPDGLEPGRLSIAEGMIADGPVGRRMDLSGFQILPGLIDVHGDGFERHVAVRRGAMKNMAEGLRAAEAELAANGVTTGVLAQFMSWEGGLRSPEFATRMFEGLKEVRGDMITDLRGQARLEIHLTEELPDLPEQLVEWGVEYLVFNDHLPHDRLAEGRKPPNVNGQALRAGRNPEKHLAYLYELNARETKGPIEALAARLRAAGVRMGSHDDDTADIRSQWRARGAEICEFPETLEAAEAAKAAGDLVVMGSPNLVRGGSHKGNVSAVDIVTMGYCDAIASDYHYPSLRRAVLFLVEAGVMDLKAAWGLVSEGPARVLGLTDRGSLRPGLRADLVVLDDASRVAGTIAGGRVSFLRGDIAERFLP